MNLYAPSACSAWEGQEKASDAPITEGTDVSMSGFALSSMQTAEQSPVPQRTSDGCLVWSTNQYT